MRRRRLSSVPAVGSRLFPLSVLLLAALSFLAAPPPAIGAGDLALRPGTIPWMRTQPIGSEVTLDAMMVDRIEPTCLVLREPLDATQTIVVDASADVKRWQSVEVTGTTALDQRGEFHLADARVRAYVDDTGEVILPPLPKPLTGPPAMLKTVDVTLALGQSPSVDSGGPPALLSEPTPGTIAWVRTLQDGADPTYPLEGKIVSRVFKNEGCYYIQEPDRSAGIRVDDASVAILQPGDVITIYEYGATIGTVDGERALSELSGQLGDPADPPLPLALGGGRSVTTPPARRAGSA